MSLYCGNNKLHSSVRSGNAVIGTRSECLRKGVGLGKYLPCNSEYNGPYEPIDNRKVWCGNSDRLPPGYDIVGTLPGCMQKGVGTGMRLKARGCRGARRYTNKLTKRAVISFIFIMFVSFGVLYTLKPKVVFDKKTKKMKWGAFIGIWFVIVVILCSLYSYKNSIILY